MKMKLLKWQVLKLVVNMESTEDIKYLKDDMSMVHIMYLKKQSFKGNGHTSPQKDIHFKIQERKL